MNSGGSPLSALPPLNFPLFSYNKLNMQQYPILPSNAEIDLMMHDLKCVLFPEVFGQMTDGDFFADKSHRFVTESKSEHILR